VDLDDERPGAYGRDVVGTVPDTGYRIVGNGEYNGDAKADILWHHATRGEVWVWLMNGRGERSENFVATVPDVGYQIVKTSSGGSPARRRDQSCWSLGGGVRPRRAAARGRREEAVTAWSATGPGRPASSCSCSARPRRPAGVAEAA